MTDKNASLTPRHAHFGYWINQARNRARCYGCGFQFSPTSDDQAEVWQPK